MENGREMIGSKVQKTLCPYCVQKEDTNINLDFKNKVHM